MDNKANEHFLFFVSINYKYNKVTCKQWKNWTDKTVYLHVTIIFDKQEDQVG